MSAAGTASARRNGLACPVPPGSKNRAKAHEGSPGTWEPRPPPSTSPAREPEHQSPRAHGRASRPLGANRAQGWYRQAKATKCGERGGRESERLIVPLRPGNHSEGPGGGKEVPCHETVGGKHGGCIETRGRVHETTTDRGTRSTKSGDGIYLSGLLRRPRLAGRGVQPHPQRRRGGRGRTGWGGLRSRPDGQPSVAAGPSQVRHVSRTAGATGPHPQGGLRDRDSAAGDTDLRG